MKLLKCYLALTFIFCGCADATPKEKISDLTCPYILPAEKDFPTSWVTLGKVPAERVQLRETTVIYGNANAEKERVTIAKERIFADEMIDEWDDFKDRSEATAEQSIESGSIDAALSAPNNYSDCNHSFSVPWNDS